MNNLLDLFLDEELNTELQEILKNSAESDDACIPIITKFANEHGVKVCNEDVKDFLAKIPLSDDDLDAVSGGAICLVDSAIASASSESPLALINKIICLKKGGFDSNSIIKKGR